MTTIADKPITIDTLSHIKCSIHFISAEYDYIDYLLFIDSLQFKYSLQFCKLNDNHYALEEGLYLSYYDSDEDLYMTIGNPILTLGHLNDLCYQLIGRHIEYR